MKVLIVEDEKNQAEILERFLLTYDYIKSIFFAESTDEFYESVITEKPDLILLDIQLFGKNSLQILKKLEEEKVSLPSVIITTSFENSEYQIEAQKYFSINYLMKPIDEDLLKRAVNRSYEIINKGKEKLQEKKNLINYLNNYSRLPFITITDTNIYLKHEEIVYFISDGNYTEVYLENGNNIIIKTNLGKIEKMLSKKIFYRVSRKLIVNIFKILSVSKKKKHITFSSTNINELAIPQKSINDLIKILNNISQP
ncbi:MAG: response regulator transcription factor [Bacteroidales bacterium]|nr:response regulator transcription factor [Bacteroidales bacterium]